jgi:hypothetical protein
MENEAYSLQFLSNEASGKFFADTDFALRAGKHIQHFGSDAKLWDYITDHYDLLFMYYEHLFGVFLRKETNDRDVYFYLEFPEDGSGKFVGDRHRLMDDRHLIIGIMLLNIYKERFFESKEVKWQQIEQVIDESEQKELWQKILYGEVKRNYTPNEKDEMKRRFERSLFLFERLGWIHWVDHEALTFMIMPSIDRIAKLYANEIANVELMSEYIHEQLP